MTFPNPLLNRDSYKQGHFLFQPPGMTNAHSYIEARKGGSFREIMFFGLQYILEALTDDIWQSDIEHAQDFNQKHGLPFDIALWKRVQDYGGGNLPLEIRALPEGIIVPHGTPLVTCEATHDSAAALAAAVETHLMRVWYPTTIATRTMRWNRLIAAACEKSGCDNPEFKLVDFGARGTSSMETAAIGGMAHLVNFQVTDNQLGISLAQQAYGPSDEMFGFSIPASEHSVTTAWGQKNERAFYEHVIDTFGRVGEPGEPRRPVSIVIDTYDQDEALRMWGIELRDKLRASSMQLVARPDSGDPIVNVIHCLDRLGTYFGFSINAKGYKMLPSEVRLIQGDGIDEDSLRRLLATLDWNKWSIDNVNFGSGGGLLTRDAERDTHRFAMKTSEVVVDGEVNEVRKVVKTDPSKASKAGRFAVLDPCDGTNAYVTIREDEMEDGQTNELRTVYHDGEIIVRDDFETVRNRAREARSRPAL